MTSVAIREGFRRSEIAAGFLGALAGVVLDINRLQFQSNPPMALMILFPCVGFAITWAFVRLIGWATAGFAAK